ncbi:MAG: AMP-binding protein [Proteobacteria bacterium]|nr:AMP-binding protein [Pseudomonadota bacterium]
MTDTQPGDFAAKSDEPWLFMPGMPNAWLSWNQFNAWVWQLHNEIEVKRPGDDCKQAIVLCEKPGNFLAAYTAALISGLSALLPPSSKPAVLTRLLEQYPQSIVISDSKLKFECSASIVMTGIPPDCLNANTVEDLPVIKADQLAAILFTSGTTGAPKENLKYWPDLTGVSELMRQRLNLNPQDCLLVAVPPQHMFGFETQILLPLLGGIRLYADRLFYPANIHIATVEMLGRGVCPSLIITPIQLRAMLESGLDFSGLRQIVCSAAPLSASLAKRTEAQWNVPVIEIFGSTETGSVASRRTAVEDIWKLYPGVSLIRQENDWLVDATYLPHQPLLDDFIELKQDNPGYFCLLGRASDLIKVGGKRASLMALNNQLRDVPGVVDGVFVMPETAAENARLSAVVVAPELDRKVLLRALSEWLDPVFLPRPLYFIERLPRSRNGKLPRAVILVMLEQLQQQQQQQPKTKTKTKTRIDCLSSVPANHPALVGHFPGKPIIPGVVLLDFLQTCFEKHFPQRWISQLPRVKFINQLRPGQQCQVLIESDSQRGSFKLINEAGKIVVSGQFRCSDAIPVEVAQDGV